MASGGTIFSRVADGVEKVEKKTEGFVKTTGIVSGVLEGFLRDVYQLVQPFSKVQDEFQKLVTNAGLAGKSIMAFSERLIEQNRRMSFSLSYGVSDDQIAKLQTEIMSKVGRNITFDIAGTGPNNEDSELENIIAAGVRMDNFADMVGKYDVLGMSMKKAAKDVGKLYKEAGEYGINFQNYSQNFLNNIEMAQQYNFRNGVNGLKEMARKATEIRQDMRQIASFADKVGSVTGAVEAAASLQVLGGSFTALANPLAMLNESMTDMEGLQERFNQMTAGAAHYNSVTKQVEMDPFTRMQIKRAAEAMGVDPNNMIQQAYTQARRGEIERQMGGFGNISEDFKKLITNAGTIDENGRAGASIGGRFYSLGELSSLSTEEQTRLQEELVAENKSESEDIKQIAKDVRTLTDKYYGGKYQLENRQASNQSMPGVYNKKTAVDLATDFFNYGINDKVVEGAGTIDRMIDSLKTTISIAGRNYVTGLFEAFSEKTPEAVAKVLSEKAVVPVFGEGDGAKKLQGWADTAIAGIGKVFFDGIGGYLKQYGLDFKSVMNEGTPGISGSEPSAAAGTGFNFVLPESSSVRMPASTVTIEAPETGTGQIIFGAKEGINGSIPSAPAVSTGAGNPQKEAQEIKQELTLGGNVTFTVDLSGLKTPVDKETSDAIIKALLEDMRKHPDTYANLLQPGFETIEKNHGTSS